MYLPPVIERKKTKWIINLPEADERNRIGLLRA